jgi:hypothetical protein
MHKPEKVKFYFKRAESLAVAREVLLFRRELARRDEFYPWDHAFDHGVGLLSVHAALSFADALLIAETGERSRGDNHMTAHSDLDAHCKTKGIDRGGLKHLQTLIGKKSKFSYGDEPYGDGELIQASTTLDQFMKWIFGTFPDVAALRTE